MSFIAELRRRNVIRMAGLYLVAAWLVTQVGATLLPVFDAPAWAMKALVTALAIGFLPALVFAWVFELTPQGLKRDADVPVSESIAPQTARRMDRAIIVILLMALGYFAFDKFVLAPRREAALVVTAQKAAVMKAVSAPVANEKSIAVLPLANDSGDKDQQYFSDGLSDDLINALMQFGNLKVIGRNSAFQFRDSKESSAAIGLKLGVAYLLTGSVRKLGETVRVNAQLVKAADGSGVWSQSYDRPYKDLFKLQDEITQAVAEALKAKLLDPGNAAVQNDRPPSGNLDAYSAYQQGRFYAARNNQPDLRAAIAHYREAVRIDPDYAAAYAALGAALSTLAGNYSLGGAESIAMFAQAQAAIDTALRLDPSLPQAHMTQAQVMATRDLDWHGSLAESRRALELAPNDPRAIGAYATRMATLGKVGESIDLMQQALKLDPLQAGIHQNMAVRLAADGRLDAAKAAIDKAVELQPGSDTYRVLQVDIEAWRGDFPTALAIARALSPGMWRDYAMAVAMQAGSDRADADAALKALVDNHTDAMAYQVAQVYAQRRDPGHAFEWLDRAWRTRDPGISFLLYDPCLLRYKDDPRFAAFARKVGLPTTSDANGLP